MARELGRRGAVIVGVDLSAALLAAARRREANDPLGVVYVRGDVSAPDILDGERFDVVACGVGLSDVDDLDGAVSTVARVLRRGGSFTFSVLHPCFAGGGAVSGSWSSAATYFDERLWYPAGAAPSLRRQVGANHRTLATSLNTVRGHGLRFDRVVEPRPPESWRAAHPNAAGQPLYLVARWVQPSADPAASADAALTSPGGPPGYG